MIEIDFYTVFWREMVVFKRKWGKFLIARIVGPLLYLIAFGWGLGQSIQVNGQNYMWYVVPGIIALSAMYTSFYSVGVTLNMSRLYHRTFEEYRLAPIGASAIVLGLVLAGSLRGMAISVIILGLAYFFGTRLIVNAAFFLVLLLTSWLFSCLGVVAAMTIDSHEEMANFNAYVITPMAFLCSTFFSANNFPKYIRYFIEALPLTHASQALRAIALGQGFPAVSLAVLLGYSLVLFAGSVIVVQRVK